MSESKLATVVGVVAGVGGILALLLGPDTIHVISAVISVGGTILAAFGASLNKPSM